MKNKTMNSYNPWMKAWANAEKQYLQSEIGKAKQTKRKKSAQEFLDGHHKYERTFSDIGTGEIKVMNGSHAKSLNDNLFQDYLAAVTSNVEGRSLERWKVVERFVQK